jgi:hypothetical protein
LLLLSGIWNIVKYFLDPVTQDKVKPCYNASAVASFIDPIYLPESMDGTCSYILPDIEYIEDTDSKE